MNRREAIKRVAWIMGGTVGGANLLLEGCTRPATPTVEKLFEPDMVDFLGDVAETILPETSSPGAKEAGVGAFIPVMVRDCYTTEDQKIFLEGLGKLEDASKAKFSKKFQELSAEEKTGLLTEIDKEAKEYSDNKKDDDPYHYFSMIMPLTLLGFVTSQLGATKALRDVKIPGKYDGNF